MVLELAATAVEEGKPVTPKEPLVEFDYAPYRMMKQVAAPWSLNADGFRAKPLSAYETDPSKRFLVVFLGGSVCVGFGGSNGEPLSDLLESELHRRGLEKVQVLNLCQGGAVSAQELAIFIQYGLPLQPNLVVSFNGANDFLHPKPIGPDEQPNLPYLNDDMRSLWLRRNGDGALASAMTQSALFRLADRLMRRIGVTRHGALEHEKQPVPASAVVSSYINMLDVTRKLTNSIGAKHVVILQPSIFMAKLMSQQEQTAIQKYHPNLDQVQKRIAELYAETNRRFISLKKSEHWAVFDLSQTFSNVPDTIYMDSVHFANRLGYPLLLEELQRQGFISLVTNQYEQWMRLRKSLNK